MKTVFILFDSLNRSALSCYGGQIQTPHFDRLASRAALFDTHFAGSLPCMPARRDMQTGRLNFLHRSWGPLEPFDDSFAARMKTAGVYSHLVSDHYHYFEDGGAGYHTRYDTWEFIRGQEYDTWKAKVSPPIQDYKKRYSEQSYDPETKQCLDSVRSPIKGKCSSYQECRILPTDFTINPIIWRIDRVTEHKCPSDAPIFDPSSLQCIKQTITSCGNLHAILSLIHLNFLS